MLSRTAETDKIQWMHTSQLLSMLYNINRGKSGKSLDWTDFHPYEIDRKKQAPPAQLNAENLATFTRMTNTLNNGKKNGST